MSAVGFDQTENPILRFFREFEGASEMCPRHCSSVKNRQGLRVDAFQSTADGSRPPLHATLEALKRAFVRQSA